MQPPTELESLPFEQQRTRLEELLLTEDGAAWALRATASWVDPEPFARCLSLCLARGLEERPRLALRDALEVLADTSLLRALRELDAAHLSRARLEPFARTLRAWLLAQGPERLEARCLAERWLLRAGFAPLEGEALARVLEGERTEAALLALTGAELRALSARDPALRAAVGALASRVLEVLARAPRGLAQAHAEELLAARVYTAEGHLLEELLQNAEDAGATRFELSVDGAELRVLHDGAPFAPRDVVGVLSVGQSTKGAGHIGTFGVGFKSVYQACARPRVYSGSFAFECVDVSRPRPLRPDPGLAAEDTLFVLPLRAPADPQRGASALARRALALPPEVLLSLAHLRSLRVRAAGLERAFALRILSPRELALEGPDGERRYRFAEREGVRVVAALDATGAAQRWPEGLATLHAFLPTLERTGLPFLLQAPFAVPIDRERVDLAAPRNADLLERALEPLCELLRGLAPSPGWERCVPLPEELAHAPLRRLAERALAELSTEPVLLAADGLARAPTRCALLYEPSLAAPLAGLPLTEDQRVALLPLDARASRVALALGARPLGPEELARFLRSLAPALRHKEPSRVAFDAALRALAREPDAALWLRGAPLCPTESWEALAPEESFLAEEPARAVYRSLRPLLHRSLDTLLRPHAPLASLWNALGVRRLDLAALLRDLAEPTLRAQLLAEEGLARVLSYVAPRGESALRALAPLPLWPCEDGALRALEGAEPALLRPAGPLAEALEAARWQGPGWLLPELARSHAEVLARAGARAPGPVELASLCARGQLLVPAASLPALYAALDALSEQLSPAQWSALRAAPWFLTRSGEARPLQGPEPALLPSEESLCALLPSASWGAPLLLRAAFLSHLRAPTVGPPEVARALLGEPSPVRLDELAPEALLAWLAERAGALSPSLREALGAAPLWSSFSGERAPLAQRRGPSPQPSLARLFARWGAAPPLSPAALQSAEALGLAPLCVPGDGDALLEELARSEPAAWPPSELLRDALAPLARGASSKLLARLLELPLARDEAGHAAPLAELLRCDDPALRALLRGAGVRLLLEEDSARWASLLDALRERLPSPAGALRERLLAQALPGEPLASQPRWLRAEGALALARATLCSLEAAALAGLPLLLNARGELCALPLFSATPEERSLCAGLALERRLCGEEPAEPALAALLRPLPAATLALALAEDAKRELPAREHPRLWDPMRRAALYAWLLAHAEELAAQDASRGALGRACVVLSRGGVLRAPRSLLLEDGLPELGLDWDASEELPGPLRAWFRRTWDLDAARLEPLVSHLLEGFERAEGPSADARREELLAHLSRALRGEEALAALPRHLKVHRRVTVACSDGARRPPREVYAPLGAERAWLEAAGASLALLHERYEADPALRAFLLAVGVREAVPPEALEALLRGEGLRPGFEARLALARYLLSRACVDGPLRAALSLDRRAWVPDARGSLARPSELCWPTDALDALLGPEALRRVHGALAGTAPFEARAVLPFRSPESLSAAEVLDAQPEAPLSLVALRWLERALAEGRSNPAEVRAAFGARALLLDDAGALCAASELFLEGEGRGLFSEGAARWPRLAGALKLRARRRPEAPAPKPLPPAAAPTEAPLEPARAEAGLLHRLRSWWDKPAPDAAPEAPPPAPSPRAPVARPPATPRAEPQERSWFAPRDTLEAQQEDGRAWLESRRKRASYGAVFVPRSLPAPYLYAPSLVAERFDPDTQRWSATGALDPAWRRPSAARGAKVSFRGLFPAGESLLLPLPFYAALEGSEARGGVLERGAEGELRLRSSRDVEVEYAVRLGGAPLFEPEGECAAPEALLQRTCPEEELPAEVHAFLDAALEGGEPALLRALAARDFVRRAYRYDPSYLEDASVAAFLRTVREGRAHGALAALHAGRSGRHLGAGVCFELNSLLCELLRRLGIGAAVCTGWVLEDGAATEPDHLWALALLPTRAGPRWLPLDAAATREGRPLRVGRRAPPPVRPPPAAPSSPEERATEGAGWSASREEKSSAPRALPQAELARVVRYAEGLAGARPLAQERLRARCRAALSDPARAAELLRWLAQER